MYRFVIAMSFIIITAIANYGYSKPEKELTIGALQGCCIKYKVKHYRKAEIYFYKINF